MKEPPKKAFPAMLHEGVDHDRLTRKLAHLREASDRFLGYPTNLDFDYGELAPFLELALNNIGDPFQQSHVELNTLESEEEATDDNDEARELVKDILVG